MPANEILERTAAKAGWVRDDSGGFRSALGTIVQVDRRDSGPAADEKPCASLNLDSRIVTVENACELGNP